MSNVLFFSFFSMLGIFILWLSSFVSLGLGFYLFSYVGTDFFSEFVVDSVSMVYLVMLFFCGSVALFYCFHYFSGSCDASLLFPLVVWFLGVMCVLVFSDGLVLSLLFWEYLGLVSFFLILFYSNGVSVRASLITLFASRFGDVCFFILVLWLTWWCGFSCFLFLSLVLLVVMTKSACFPFVSWLLEAMRAPTPVSSLVHSSTLVAAGVWFLLRYSAFFGSFSLACLFFFCSLTVVVSGICASFFNDLKKVVALSTCNNVSWCVIFFVCGDLWLCLFQLLAHGVCKCFLFMSVGDLMGMAMGSQSSVNVFLSRYSGFYGVLVRTFLIVSLSGLPFLGVFFSKHLFFSVVFYCFSWAGLFFIFIGFVLTYCYSVRLVLLLVRSSSGNSFGYGGSFMFVAGLVLLGSVLNYFYVGSADEDLILGCLFSNLIMFGQIIGCFLGFLIFSFYTGISFWQSLLWGNDCLVSLFYTWFGFISSVSVLSFYRWEVALGNLFTCFSHKGGMSTGFAFISFNFFIYCVVCVLFFSFFVLV